MSRTLRCLAGFLVLVVIGPAVGCSDSDKPLTPEERAETEALLQEISEQLPGRPGMSGRPQAPPRRPPVPRRPQGG